MYLTNEQLQELWDTGIDEKIEKFAELFPNGTEVTYDLCVKHPDVFSFGLPGARLLPRHVRWKPYWDKVHKAKANYKLMMVMHKKMGMGNPSHMRDNNRPLLLSDIFKSGPPIPYPYIPAGPGTISILSAEYPMREYNFKLALIFYETSIM